MNSHHNKVCDGGYDKRRKHKINVSKEVHTVGEKKGKINYNNNGTNKLDRYRIPEDLIYSLFLD